MNEVEALRAVKQFIVYNDDDLTHGLEHQGQPIVLKQVTTSGHTPVNTYPFISILSSDDEETWDFANDADGKKFDIYDVVIGVIGKAYVQAGDDQPYEVSDTYHKMLCDRIVSLIGQQRFFEDDESGIKFRLEKESGIRRSNSGLARRDEAGNYHSILNTDIRFTLAQRC